MTKAECPNDIALWHSTLIRHLTFDIRHSSFPHAGLAFAKLDRLADPLAEVVQLGPAGDAAPLVLAFENPRVDVHRVADRELRRLGLEAALLDELEDLLAHGWFPCLGNSFVELVGGSRKCFG